MSGDSSTTELDPYIQQEKKRYHELYRKNVFVASWKLGLLFEQLAAPFSLGGTTCPLDLYMLSSRAKQCAQLLSSLNNILDAQKAQTASLADGPHADAMEMFQNSIEQVKSKVEEFAGNLPQRQAEIDAHIKKWEDLGF
ncbi:MAG: hypothetical protein Q9179_001156 [Wetmoreana sp. 5 TL-2023]